MELVLFIIYFRYLRLTGIYAFILFFMVSLWAHLGLGPGHTNQLETDYCKKNPWTNLLYVNNFFPGTYDNTDDWANVSYIGFKMNY